MVYSVNEGSWQAGECADLSRKTAVSGMHKISGLPGNFTEGFCPQLSRSCGLEKDEAVQRSVCIFLRTLTSPLLSVLSYSLNLMRRSIAWQSSADLKIQRTTRMPWTLSERHRGRPPNSTSMLCAGIFSTVITGADPCPTSSKLGGDVQYVAVAPLSCGAVASPSFTVPSAPRLFQARLLST